MTKTFQGVQVSSKLQQVLASEPITFFLGLLRDTHAFLLSSSDLYSFLGLISLRKVSHQNFFQKGEFDGSDQKSQPGELNGPLPSFICSISDGTIPESGDTDHLFLLDQLPSSLQAKTSTDIDRIPSAPPIEIQIDSSKPFSRINQYPINNKHL